MNGAPQQTHQSPKASPAISLHTPFEDDRSFFVSFSSNGSNASQTPASPIAQSPHRKLILPTLYQKVAPQHSRLPPGAVSLTTVDGDLHAFFAQELNVSRLNRLHNHLWLAGLERPARPLHQQVAIGRTIVVTESADLHLLWEDIRIYVKPLPEFLLCAAAWDQYLNRSKEMHERACGLLLSYLWLISYPSDWRLAQTFGLLPADMSWECWTDLARCISTNMDIQTLNGINIRYRYGELRLRRINWITRLCSAMSGVTGSFRGHGHGYTHLSSFIERNLGWLVTAAVYIGLVLTAMQVGLATDRLASNTSFQRAAYGFTVFAIIAPVGIATVVLLLLIVLLLFNLRYTLSSTADWSQVQAIEYKHEGMQRC